MSLGGSRKIPFPEKGEVMPLFQGGILNEKGELVRESVIPEIPTIKELYESIFGKSPSVYYGRQL